MSAAARAGSAFWPSPAEAACLRFLVPVARNLRGRVLLAGALFVLGLALAALSPQAWWLGLLIALCGHLPLWVRTQTTAPGGATPLHEEVWAPAEPDWSERVAELERKGKAWDASPWDVTCVRGFLAFLLALAFVAGVFFFGLVLGTDAAFRLAAAAAVVLLPIWWNGIRSTWHPSELRLKGDALAVARRVAAEETDDLDPVPMLALRESARGKYPVDARLMLRPSADDGSGFLGVQVQVAINNVQGTDYPYLYCVILGKPGFELRSPGRGNAAGRGSLRLVFERGEGEDVTYLVVRRHADNRGGWHTKPRAIAQITSAALREARAAREQNRRRTAADKESR